VVSATLSNAQYNGLDLLDGKQKKEVQFEYINGFIMVKLIYGELLYMNFLLDTGASHNILFKKNANDLLGYTYSDTIYVSGADVEAEMMALVSRNVPIQLVGTKMIMRDVIILNEDYIDLEKVLGRRVDGIIGGDFLRGLVLEINYRRKKIVIHNPISYKSPNGYTKHDISLINYKPYLKANTSIETKSSQLQYLLDTGAALALLIHSNKVEDIPLPKNTIIGNLGTGLGGDLTGYVGLTDRLSFENYEFNNIVTSFQDIDSSTLATKRIERDGIIGNVILSRFNIIIDYMREKMYLKNIRELDEEFVYDKSGMLIYASGKDLDQYFVKAVYPNTPASEAGILPGDKILKIGFWPLSFYSIESITSKLSGKPGKLIKMKLSRGEQNIKVRFRLRDLLKSSKQN